MKDGDNVTIWKFQLVGKESVIPLPADAQFLAVQMQGPDLDQLPMVWFKLMPPASSSTHLGKLTTRRFRIRATGENWLQHKETYLGTFQTHSGNGVWHLFELL